MIQFKDFEEVHVPNYPPYFRYTDGEEDYKSKNVIE